MLAAIAAVLTGINAVLPTAPPTAEVVRAAARLEGGAVLTAGDLTVSRMPLDTIPEGALTDAGAVLGKTLTSPVPKGQVLTKLSVAGGRSVRSGRVVAPLRLADADLAALLEVGDAVDVIAADGEARAAAIIARGVRVVALPKAPETEGIGSSAATSSGTLVLVDVDSVTATVLAQAAVTATLSVVLR